MCTSICIYVCMSLCVRVYLLLLQITLCMKKRIINFSLFCSLVVFDLIFRTSSVLFYIFNFIFIFCVTFFFIFLSLSIFLFCYSIVLCHSRSLYVNTSQSFSLPFRHSPCLVTYRHLPRLALLYF